MLHPIKAEQPSSVSMEIAAIGDLAPSPQSEAVADELQELSLKPDPMPLQERKNVLQLKLQQRRTREELVSQGIMPPLKSPAAFHEQRRSLERARTEDYLKRKIRSRPERSELVRMHILEETSAEPSLQAKQLQLKRARLADDLNDKISHRPGPIELVHKNILSVTIPLQHSPLESPNGAGGESSSLDEDSSDALSPEQLNSHDSPLSAAPQLSPSEALVQNGSASPTQVLSQPPPPPPAPPPPPLINGSDSPPPLKLTNGASGISITARPSSGHFKAKSSSDRSSHRSKKPKDSKPKVKKLKYHQYIPPDQKADKERPPQMDSSYAKLLQQQQLFLQLQILNQQQQHYNYHTILPAPPKPSCEQPPTPNSGPSPSRCVPTTTTSAPPSQGGTTRQSQSAAGGAKPGTLPANLDEFKVAELKQELKLRGLTVSGTKNDLIERLRNYQEQNGISTAALKNGISTSASTANAPTSSPTTATTPDHTPGDGGFKISLSSLGQAVPGRVMRFGSSSSSPPVSPSPSERSLAGMSPDETSCNGDLFGEMVSSPLTQLTLHHSPQHPPNLSPLSQAPPIKEESQNSCSLSRSSCSSLLPVESLDKDQMLQEKDKQIEELTKMLKQKQRLVETLRSQLEQGKVGVVITGEVREKPPLIPNGVAVKVKQEMEPEENMEGVAEEAQTKKASQPMQCSQETLLRLQQIHRLQLQQAEQQKHQLQKPAENQSNLQQKQQQQQKKDAQILLQQQQLQQLIIQQTQQKQLQAQQKLAQHKLAQQKLKGQIQTPQKNHMQQKQAPMLNQKLVVNQAQQRKQLKAQHQKQQQALATQQQNSSQVQTQAISLDLLKANGTPTLVTDSNGNHYLIALTSPTADGQNQTSPAAKTSGRVTLQRIQSSPSKLPSMNDQSKERNEAEPVSQPIKKGPKTSLHLDTNGAPQSSPVVSAPPSLQPFFDDASIDGESQTNIVSPLKENGVNSQQMDDLFDILLKSGEIPSFKSPPEPSLAPLQTELVPPGSPLSPLHLSPPREPAETLSSPQPPQSDPCSRSGRLEDFLESTTGAPLLGVEPDGGLTLIDDLHSQMLSTASILDHPSSPMDTSDLGFSPHSTGLDFGDPTLDSMDWLDISMVGNGGSGGVQGENGVGGGREGGTSLAPLAPHTPQSVFSTDFLDSTDLQLHWESCL